MHPDPTSIPYGYCHCGCGQKTNIAQRTQTKVGWVKGEPYRFVRGHSLGRADRSRRPGPQYRVDPATGCWVWIRALTADGYGWVKIDGRMRRAHSAYYERLVGPVPAGLQLDHLCRNRACVNPDHLEPVTSRENTMRGKSVAAINAQKTHCCRGHEFTPENTIVSVDGRRCRTCVRASQRAYDARKKQKLGALGD